MAATMSNPSACGAGIPNEAALPKKNRYIAAPNSGPIR